MTTRNASPAMSASEITKSLAFLLLYFSLGVAMVIAVALGVSTLGTGYDGSTVVFGTFAFIVALVSSALVGLCVLLTLSPLIYTLGGRLSAKLTWTGRIVAYFGFAVLAATGTVVGGLPIAPLINAQPADWNPGEFLANPADSLVAVAIIMVAGLSAAAACVTIRHSSIREKREAEEAMDGLIPANVSSMEERP